MTLPQANKHEIPDQRDLAVTIVQLHRMKNFYDDKAPTTNTKTQREMFLDFSKALQYAMDVLNKYDAVTKELAQTADKTV